LGRFTQPDLIIPENQGVQAWDRYAYVNNNPVRYSDLTGHCIFGLDTAICVELILHLIAEVLVTDLADGRFDTLRNAQTTVNTTASALMGSPFSNYRDPTLATALGGGGTPDLTSWLVNTMTANASGPIAAILNRANSGGLADKYAAYMGWAAMVKGGGPWDFKPDLSKAGVSTVILGGHSFGFDIVANIHYGFVGAASGFSLNELLLGAGAAQLASGTSSWSYAGSNFDDPRDQAAIWLGFWLYGQYGIDLTIDQFVQAIDQYEKFLRASN
jgi:hypothetical protein